jgi:hypothetical protein
MIIRDSQELQNLQTIVDQISKMPRSAEVVVVSKRQQVEKIIPLLAAGHQVFAENRVSEAKAKWTQLKELYPNTKLHMIGPLQSNKIKEVVKIFDVIESVDNITYARIILAELKKQNKAIDCYVQVNTSREPQKSGVSPEGADQLIAACRDIMLPVKGVMCIPSASKDSSNDFQLLCQIANKNNLDIVSMGMSEDYEKAILNGATHVRIGRAIFSS